MRDGGSLTGKVERERGDPRDPLSWDELVSKYRDCAARVLPENQISRSLDLITRFEEIGIDELARTLSLNRSSGSGPPR